MTAAGYKRKIKDGDKVLLVRRGVKTKELKFCEIEQLNGREVYVFTGLLLCDRVDVYTQRDFNFERYKSDLLEAGF